MITSLLLFFNTLSIEAETSIRQIEPVSKKTGCKSLIYPMINIQDSKVMEEQSVYSTYYIKVCRKD